MKRVYKTEKDLEIFYEINFRISNKLPSCAAR